LKYVHNESKDIDFMIRLREVIAGMIASEKCPTRKHFENLIAASIALADKCDAEMEYEAPRPCSCRLYKEKP
jgi:hypothetical protein